MELKTLDNLYQEYPDLTNKVILLRIDINSDVISVKKKKDNKENKKVVESERIKASAKTINELLEKNAQIILLGHQGKPGKEDFTSLKKHAKYLNRYTKVKFIPDIFGKKTDKILKKIKKQKENKKGKAILLENIRNLEEEFSPEKKDNKITNFFKNKCDLYVNDAFSVSHRNQASVILGKKFPEKSYAGRLLEKEISALEKMDELKRENNFTYILGGAKPEDNLKLLEKADNKNKTLACGLFAQMILISKGKKLGKQEEFLKKKLKDFQGVLEELKKTDLERIFLPEDFAVKYKGNKGKTIRKELPLESFPNDYEIFDVGSKTLKKYSKEIKKSSGIYMKGPVGDASDKKFLKGTKSILKAVGKSKAYSIIGGGHLTDALRNSKISKKKFNHVSLSGGALLNYIAGENLLGLEGLEKNKVQEIDKQ